MRSEAVSCANARTAQAGPRSNACHARLASFREAKDYESARERTTGVAWREARDCTQPVRCSARCLTSSRLRSSFMSFNTRRRTSDKLGRNGVRAAFARRSWRDLHTLRLASFRDGLDGPSEHAHCRRISGFGRRTTRAKILPLPRPGFAAAPWLRGRALCAGVARAGWIACNAFSFSSYWRRDVDTSGRLARA